MILAASVRRQSLVTAGGPAVAATARLAGLPLALLTWSALPLVAVLLVHRLGGTPWAVRLTA